MVSFKLTDLVNFLFQLSSIAFSFLSTLHMLVVVADFIFSIGFLAILFTLLFKELIKELSVSLSVYPNLVSDEIK